MEKRGKNKGPILFYIGPSPLTLVCPFEVIFGRSRPNSWSLKITVRGRDSKKEEGREDTGSVVPQGPSLLSPEFRNPWTSSTLSLPPLTRST